MSIDADKLGIKNIKTIYHNLNYEALYTHEIEKNEGQEVSSETVAVDTGIFTGRSPKDKYFVEQSPSKENIAWGKVNKPVSKEIFDMLFKKVKENLSGKELYIQDAFAGSSDESKRSIRVISEIAWQAHFVKNMLIRPTKEELKGFSPDFTIYAAPKATNDDFKNQGLNSEVFIIFNLEEKITIIGGTWYGGEIKKGVFSLMNYWLPLEGKLSMHCSANIGEEGDTALFFGLSGTGKTTLSADPNRRLIGDDEHGWDEKGIFNIEGGCYAKCIGLEERKEPEIYGAIKRDALLENVVIDDNNDVDFHDGSKTENTRVSYPIHHIENHEVTLMGGHPKNIIFLTADAFGVLPPISKLNKEQAMYYFLSGYTAKVAGTERGVTEPTATFSACFGEPFFPLHPTVYAKLLGEKMQEHHVNVFLVNTGWGSGEYGTGERISLKHTRACVNAALNGELNTVPYETLEIFGLKVPKEVSNVPSEILNPRNVWKDKEAYDSMRKKLALMFIDNFKRYQTKESSFDYSIAGPKI